MAGVGEPQNSGPSCRFVADGRRAADGVGRVHIFSCARIADVLAGPGRRDFSADCGRIDGNADTRAVRMGGADVRGDRWVAGGARACGSDAGDARSIARTSRMPAR